MGGPRESVYKAPTGTIVLPEPTETEAARIEELVAPLRNPNATIADKLRWCHSAINQMITNDTSVVKTRFIHSPEFVAFMENQEVFEMLTKKNRQAELRQILFGDEQ